MSWHMSCQIGNDDKYTPVTSNKDQLGHIIFDTAPAQATVSTNTWEILDRNGLTPTPLATDFYRVTVAAYTADQRINRSKHGFDQWSRDIVLHLPVTDLELWNEVKEPFEQLLSFLTGDHWTLHFRHSEFQRLQRHERLFANATATQAKQVCFLSGGLDSFIGAIDCLSKKEPTLFVSHYGGGTGTATAKVQERVIQALGSKFGNDLFQTAMFHVEPAVRITNEREQSSRSRSILFFGLAVLAGSALGENTRLIVPENGFISLNVPLTSSRLGSHTTRTTHPYILDLLRNVLQKLNINIDLANPYQFMTKGEMVKACLDKRFLKQQVTLTVSCAHPQSGRFRGGVGSGFRQCGYCVPCLIRQASLHHAKWTGIEDYTFNPLSRKPTTEAEQEHIFAFRMALHRFANEPHLPQLLSAGPLQCSPEDLDSYLSVYERGMKEVGKFFGSMKS
jgi:7-cyano-7-deazaguanine synthase in queuosine biosynthesis